MQLTCAKLTNQLLSLKLRFASLFETRVCSPQGKGIGVCLLVGCLTSQQHASVSHGRICSDNMTCCHTQIEAADQTFYLTQSQYTVIGPTSPSTDYIMSGAWQGSHWSAHFEVTGMTLTGKIPPQAGFEPRIFRSRGGRLNHQANEAVRERGLPWKWDTEAELLTVCWFLTSQQHASVFQRRMKQTSWGTNPNYLSQNNSLFLFPVVCISS